MLLELCAWDFDLSSLDGFLEVLIQLLQAFGSGFGGCEIVRSLDRYLWRFLLLNLLLLQHSQTGPSVIKLT